MKFSAYNDDGRSMQSAKSLKAIFEIYQGYKKAKAPPGKESGGAFSLSDNKTITRLDDSMVGKFDIF